MNAPVNHAIFAAAQVFHAASQTQAGDFLVTVVDGCTIYQEQDDVLTIDMEDLA